MFKCHLIQCMGCSTRWVRDATLQNPPAVLWQDWMWHGITARGRCWLWVMFSPTQSCPNEHVGSWGNGDGCCPAATVLLQAVEWVCQTEVGLEATPSSCFTTICIKYYSRRNICGVALIPWPILRCPIIPVAAPCVGPAIKWDRSLCLRTHSSHQLTFHGSRVTIAFPGQTALSIRERSNYPLYNGAQ